MDLKAAFNRMKSTPNKQLFFFYVEKGEDGKPVLVVDAKAITKEESDGILATAKVKTKAGGKLAIDDQSNLLIYPRGNAPSSLAKGITAAAKNAQAKVFQEVEINPDDEDGDQPVAPSEVKEMTKRIKALEPKIEAAKGHHDGEKIEGLHEKMNDLQKKMQIAQAMKVLDQLEDLVTNPDRDAWNKEFTELEPKYLKNLKDVPKNATKLRAFMAFASEKAEASDFAKARAGLVQVEKVLNAPPEVIVPKAAIKPATGEDILAQITKLEPRFKKVLEDKPHHAVKMKGLLAFARDKAEANDPVKAMASLKQLIRLMNAPPEIHPAKMKIWQTERDSAVGQIRQLAKQQAKEAGSPDAARKTLLSLNGVIRNLKDPRTPQQVDELVRYLDRDDVVAKASKAADFKTPLLKALSGMKK